jgi:hypothetical protein
MSVKLFKRSQLPQSLQLLQNPLDLLGAFLVLAAEEGGEKFGVRSGENSAQKTCGTFAGFYDAAVKDSRLATLPAAARVASIRLREDGRLQVKLRYVCQPWEKGSCWFGSDHEYQGVPYQRWHAHAGRIVRLWEWEGTGEGMIGGPAKRQVGVIFWGGAAEFPYQHSAEECLSTADELEAWLADDRYDFTDRNREEVLAKIAQLRQPHEWHFGYRRFYNSPPVLSAWG